MSVKFQTITTASHTSVPTHHTFAAQEGGADQLLIILPGYGYTSDFPLLYYLRRAATQLGYDVLSVEYGFQAAHTKFDFSNTPDLLTDVQAAVAALPPHPYRHICIAGKSMGTLLTAGLAETLSAQDISLLLLTPVSGAVEMAGTHPALAIIGTADSRYNAAAIQDTRTLKWRVFDGLDHSLEAPDDWLASLTVLPHIITACADFLS